MTDPLAPKNLGEAFGYIHEQIQQRKAKSNGHGTKAPNKFCTVCGVLFHHQAILVDPELRPMPCASCKKELDDGKIAVICPIDKRYAFIADEELKSHGPVIEVSKEVMDAVEERAKENG